MYICKFSTALVISSLLALTGMRVAGNKQQQAPAYSA